MDGWSAIRMCSSIFWWQRPPSWPRHPGFPLLWWAGRFRPESSWPPGRWSLADTEKHRYNRRHRKWQENASLTRLNLICHLHGCKTILCERRRVPLEESTCMMTDGIGLRVNGGKFDCWSGSSFNWSMSTSQSVCVRVCMSAPPGRSEVRGSRCCMKRWCPCACRPATNQWEREKFSTAPSLASSQCSTAQPRSAGKACHNTGQRVEAERGGEPKREGNGAKGQMEQNHPRCKNNKSQLLMWHLVISHMKTWDGKEKAIGRICHILRVDLGIFFFFFFKFSFNVLSVIIHYSDICYTFINFFLLILITVISLCKVFTV